jgi:antitoxin component YwqK of YwqJK toxin-antitoxin module
MKVLFLFICISITPVFAQTIRKENLTKKVANHYDFQKTKLESEGAYYKDALGETNEKHGKWLYYDKNGVEIEERNYYRGKLNGAVLAYFSNRQKRSEGYFKLDKQDSVFREWNEFGALQLDGYFKLGKPFGVWKTYYLSGQQQKTEEILDSTVYVQAFWLDDSLHTQTINNGSGNLTVYYNTGMLKEQYAYKDGLKNGSFIEKSIYGHTLLTGKFVNGIKDSTWNYYYYTGPLEKISNYSNGKLHGAYAYYYDNKQLNVEGHYKNGEKSGHWIWYNNKGIKDQEGDFENGKQHGNWTFYYPTGEVSYTAVFDHDKKTGTWNYFYKDGSAFKKGNFANDEKNGLWETWYEDGTLLMKGNYKNGKEQGIWVNNWENGKAKNIATFTNGQLNGRWVSYFPTGNLKLEGTYKNGYKVKAWTTYFDNGKIQDLFTYKVVTKKTKHIDYGPLKDFKTQESIKNGDSESYSQKDYKKIEEGSYKNGEKNGVWYTYWPGGKIPSNITSYKMGKLDGKSVEYDRRGNIMSEVNYLDGLKHGKMKLYDKKGKVIKEMNFENGQQVGIGGNSSFNPR